MTESDLIITNPQLLCDHRDCPATANTWLYFGSFTLFMCGHHADRIDPEQRHRECLDHARST